MAYDPVKAHEYYVKYRKKGLKKGRKKGSSKSKSKTKTGSTAFLGVSSQGFNDEGRMQAALIKENIKKEMKTALASAKTDEERQKIRLEYSRKAQQEINKLKSNAQYVKPKKAKASSSKSSGSKTSSSKSSGSKTSTPQQAKTSATKPTMSAQMKKAIADMQSKINDILSSDKIANLSDQEKADLRTQLSGMLAKIRKMYKR